MDVVRERQLVRERDRNNGKRGDERCEDNDLYCVASKCDRTTKNRERGI
jgi:hypothetical protein